MPKVLSAMVAIVALGLLAAAPAVAQEQVRFPSSDSDLTKGAPTQIDAYLFRPEGAGPFPAVVGMHGCGGLFNRAGKLQARESAWAALLNARGYAVLYPDSFGSRQITGGCGGNGPAVRPWAERPRDAYGALAYLQGLPFISAERIGLMGWSHGGGTVVFTIGKTSEARPRTLPKGDFRAAVAFYAGWCNAQAQGPDWGTRIPALFLHGALDDWTQAGPCHDLVTNAARNGSPVEMTIYPDAYHDFDWPGDPVHTYNAGTSHLKIVHMGFNQAAHDDAVVRVPAFFDAHLKN